MVAALTWPDGWEWLKWLAIIILAAVVYVWVVVRFWNWFLDFRGPRDPEQEWREQEEQAEYYRQRAGGPVFTAADKSFLKGLRSMVPDHGEGPKMLYVEYTHMAKAQRVRPGGFVLVAGPYETVTEYFKARRWERLPFLFYGRHIYRKPLY